MFKYSRNQSNSKSYRATQSESEGRFPATQFAKLVGGISSKAVDAILPSSEWHHSGSFAAEVNYYDAVPFLAIRNKDISDYRTDISDEELEEAAELYGKMKDWDKANRAVAKISNKTTYINSTFKWTEWYGSGRRKSKSEYSWENATIIIVEGKSLATIISATGKEMRKALSGNWVNYTLGTKI